MPFVTLKRLTLTLALGQGLVACAAANLSSGRSGSSHSPAKKDESSGGNSNQPLGNSTATDGPDNTTDPGDAVEPQNIAGAYLTCNYASATAGSAAFDCLAYRNGQVESTKIKAVSAAKLTGGAIDLYASAGDDQIDTSDSQTLHVTVTGSGLAPVGAQVPFGIELEATFVGGSSATLSTRSNLYLPARVYSTQPRYADFVCSYNVVPDGREFDVCFNPQNATSTSPIPVKWTEVTGAKVTNFKTNVVAEVNGSCDTSQRAPVPFTEAECECNAGTFDGTILVGDVLPAAKSICLEVQANLRVGGVKTTISGLAH